MDVTVIGAGAIAQQSYLPTIAALSDVNLKFVVDIDEERASTLATEFGADHAASDYTDTLDASDAAIVATPPKFHADIAEKCFDHGLHVLTEKPAALTSERASDLVSTSVEEGLHYAISRQMRESRICRLFHDFIVNDRIGTISRVDISFGDETHWDFASDYRIRPDMAGGGVLTDRGPHILDLMLWYFGPDVTVDRYRDDNYGGLEANCWIDLSSNRSDMDISIEISGSRTVPNELSITGSRGTLEADLHGDHVSLQHPESGSFTQLEPPQRESDSFLHRVGKQAKRFFDGVQTDGDSYVHVRESVDLLEIIEACYSSREVALQSWNQIEPLQDRS